MVELLDGKAFYSAERWGEKNAEKLVGSTVADLVLSTDAKPVVYSVVLTVANSVFETAVM